MVTEIKCNDIILATPLCEGSGSEVKPSCHYESRPVPSCQDTNAPSSPLYNCKPPPSSPFCEGNSLPSILFDKKLPPSPLYGGKLPSLPIYDGKLPSSLLHDGKLPLSPLHDGKLPSSPLYSEKFPPSPLYDGKLQSSPLYDGKPPPSSLYGSNLAQSPPEGACHYGTALFPYLAKCDTELSFNPGDKIQILSQVFAGSGWFWGCKGNQTGFISREYIQLEHKSDDLEQSGTILYDFCDSDIV